MLFLADTCEALEPIIKLVKAFLNLIKFGIPIVLIVLGTIDLGKAVMASKDDEMKKAQTTLLKRVIYAVVIFLLVTIVQLVMGLVSSNANQEAISWQSCWNNTNSTDEIDAAQ